LNIAVITMLMTGDELLEITHSILEELKKEDK